MRGARFDPAQRGRAVDCRDFPSAGRGTRLSHSRISRSGPTSHETAALHRGARRLVGHGAGAAAAAARRHARHQRAAAQSEFRCPGRGAAPARPCRGREPRLRLSLRRRAQRPLPGAGAGARRPRRRRDRDPRHAGGARGEGGHGDDADPRGDGGRRRSRDHRPQPGEAGAQHDGLRRLCARDRGKARRAAARSPPQGRTGRRADEPVEPVAPGGVARGRGGARRRGPRGAGARRAQRRRHRTGLRCGDALARPTASWSEATR